MIPDDAYTAEIEAAATAPGDLVFILGPQRSGTTLLHRLLVATQAFRHVSAFDIAGFDSLLHDHRSSLTRERRAALDGTIKARQTNRGIDAIPVEASAPEEYGLLLTSSGIRMGQAELTPGTLQRFRTLLGKKALIETTARPLLLKNPPDYAALDWLRNCFPNARFVVLHRHPLVVLRSQLRAGRALLARRNDYLALLDQGYAALLEDHRAKLRLQFMLYAPSGAEWLARNLLAAHEACLSVLERRPPRLLTIRYEDLLAQPRATLGRLCSFLGVEGALSELPPGARPSLPLPLVDAAYAALRPAFGPILSRLGYPDLPDGAILA